MRGLGNNQAMTSQMGSVAAPDSRRPRNGRRAFWIHFGEMLLAMVAGMVVLGGAVEGVLALAGSSLSNASASVAAVVMAFNMTVPMVGWMRYRGHPARHNAEMAGSMIVPTALVIGLHLLGAIPGSAVMAIQHVVMIPAMLGVMLWRYEHYAADHHRH